MKIERILAATDFSASAEAAVRCAVRIAKRCGASIELAHALHLPPLAEAWHKLFQQEGITEGTLSNGIAHRLNDLASLLDEDREVISNTCVLTGKPAAALAKWARESSADLIVIGTHGENLLLDPLLGSTAMKLMRLAATPVLAIKRARRYDHECVMIATDFSPAAKVAAERVAVLLPDVDLYLFHAYEVQFEREMFYAGCDQKTVDHYRMLGEVEARMQMQRFIDTLAEPARYVGTVRHGYPPALIVEHAQALRADLVVLGTHRQSEIEAALLGSVAAHLVNESPIDLLLVPSSDATPESR